MLRDPDTLLVLLGGILLVMESVAIVRRFPQLGLWLFMSAAVASTFTWYPSVGFADFQVFPLDAAAVVLGSAAVLKLSGNSRLQRSYWVLAALFGIALLRGVAVFGPQVAVNASRQVLCLLVAVVFTHLCVGEDAWGKVQTMLTVFGAALVALAAWFVAVYGLGTYSENGVRALISAQSMIVAQAGLVSLMVGGRQRLAFAALCFLTVLITQQRTVWAATLVACVVLAYGRGPLAGAARAMRRGLVVATVAVAVLMPIGPASLRDSLSTATTNVSADTGTFRWRIDGWVELLQRFSNKSGLDRLLGQPLGASFVRGAGGSGDVSPHNMYITMLISFGYIGLIAFVALMVTAIRRANAGAVGHRSLLIGLLVFSVGYQLAPEQGLVIGAALALAPVGLGRTRQLQTA